MEGDGFFGEETEQQMQDIKRGNTAILVIVRVRPLTPREKTINSTPIVHVLDNRTVALSHHEHPDNKNRIREAQFSFHFAYP